MNLNIRTILAFLFFFTVSSLAQDGTIYPLDSPTEPNAIPLGTGGVDTDRLGMIGFSAVAGLTMHSILNSQIMDLAFTGPIYGGMGTVDVPKDAPPMFNVIAVDDFLFRGQFGVINSWYEAGLPVEFHLYQNGGHGFGLGNPDRTSNRWFDAFIHWLEVNDFLAANSGE